MLRDKGLLSSARRGVVLTMIAALGLTTSAPPLVAAPAASGSRGISTAVAPSRATDFSAARRHHHHYHRGGSAAGAAFFGLALGMAAGAIAAQQRRDYYEHYGYYGPGYSYGPGYGYYGGPYYYGPRYDYPPY